MSNYNPEIHHRKSYRLRGYDYSQPGYYFVTICLKTAACMFAVQSRGHMELTPVGVIAKEYWEGIPDHFPYVGLDEFVVMKDHMHGIIVIKNNGNHRGSGVVGTFHGTSFILKKIERPSF